MVDLTKKLYPTSEEISAAEKGLALIILQF